MIVVRIEVEFGKEDLVKFELLKFVELICVEDGCLQYDLYEDNEMLGVFVFYENWES